MQIDGSVSPAFVCSGERWCIKHQWNVYWNYARRMFGRYHTQLL